MLASNSFSFACLHLCTSQARLLLSFNSRYVSIISPATVSPSVEYPVCDEQVILLPVQQGFWRWLQYNATTNPSQVVLSPNEFTLYQEEAELSVLLFFLLHLTMKYSGLPVWVEHKRIFHSENIFFKSLFKVMVNSTCCLPGCCMIHPINTKVGRFTHTKRLITNFFILQMDFFFLHCCSSVFIFCV